MNTVPHIGVTLQQRRLLNVHRASSLYELERMERLNADLQLDALREGVRQPDPCLFCAPCDDTPASAPRWLVVLMIAGWLSLLAIGLGWNLRVVQVFVHVLRHLP